MLSVFPGICTGNETMTSTQVLLMQGVFLAHLCEGSFSEVFLVSQPDAISGILGSPGFCWMYSENWYIVDIYPFDRHHDVRLPACSHNEQNVWHVTVSHRSISIVTYPSVP